NKDTVSANSKQIEGLTDNTKYYWRVSALNNAGNSSDTSTTFNFTTGIATGIGENDITPQNYSLSQNYPNPFNPTTNITFTISKESLVTLKIYDVLGKVVVQLVNQRLKTGTYKYSFNAARITSGVYFYRLTAGRFISTKKMILLK
ncbi:MAG: T9SS type A sorting domain-containing protein, partial [Bacteroidetes bacterium]|nr:T9SS type A sorting domain-containing protein [Bacteroidota bacterium]